MVVEQLPPLQSAIETLRKMGFFDIVLPFLLVFAVVFATLEKTKIFGEKKSGINSVIAFVVALTVIATANLVGIIQGFTQYIGILIIFIVVILMSVVLVLGKPLSEFKGERGPGAIKWLVVIIAIVGVIGAMLYGLFGEQVMPMFSQIFSVVSPADWSLIIFIIVIVAIVYLMTRAPKGSAPASGP